MALTGKRARAIEREQNEGNNRATGGEVAPNGRHGVCVLQSNG